MDLVEFLRTVVTGEKGWLCIAYAHIEDGDEKKTKASWNEEFFSWPDELPIAINRISELSDRYDCYFSPYLFKEPASTKDNVIIGRTIVADLDEANVLILPIEPTVLVETSTGRHQGYWILKDELDTEEHEALSRKITYSIPRCDKTGWFRGKKVRLPGTYNNKYKNTRHYIRVVNYNTRTYTKLQLDSVASTTELFGKSDIHIDEENLIWAEQALEQDVGPQEMLSRVRSTVPTIVARYNLVQQDRSVALWSLYLALFRAGMSKDKIFYLAYHSPNNKFKDLKYGGIRELAKDVLRAELASKQQIPDIKAKIAGARVLGEHAFERNAYIAKCVKEHLEKLGIFIHASDDSAWYIRSDTGQPIKISSRSSSLLTVLDIIFGINAAEKESSYVNHSLASMVADLPITGRVASLSHYDHSLRMFMLHTGHKDVLVVKENGITRETNGYQGIVFPWTLSSNTISPNYQSLDSPWEDEIFDDCLDNIFAIDKEAAKAVLKVWFLSVLLRDGLSTRPILTLLGQPGSGKSTLFRRVYTLMYGKEKAINAVSNEDNFDLAMATDPLVVLDNADTYHKWLPDRLAATISPTEITKRKLYTDGDTFVLRRQAMLGITAHNPKFGREDVTDRLLLLTFERLEHFKPESAIYDRILRLRNALWGSILRDIQTILGTDFPREGYPQFRIEDFAQFGYWIAKALGISVQFTLGIDSIRNSQKSFNIEEDTILIDAIIALLEREPINEMSAGKLWNKLRARSKDERNFDKKYTNAVALGRKFSTLMDTLRELFDVDWKIQRGVRLWTITMKKDVVHASVA